MEIYDIVMLVILIGAGIFGAVKGFAWQLASIASILVSYMVALRFSESFSKSIKAEPPWNQLLAMLILFIGTSLIIWVGFRMISNTIDRMKLREFDRQIGALFGLAKGALYCTLATMFAVTLLGDGIREKIVASKSGHFIARTLSRSEAVLPPKIHDVIGKYLDRFDERFNGTAPADESFPGLPGVAGEQVEQWLDSASQAFPGGDGNAMPGGQGFPSTNAVPFQQPEYQARPLNF